MSDSDVREPTTERTTERCTRCGAEFAATSSPLGLCPACLLKLGMSDPAIARLSSTAQGVPSNVERRDSASGRRFRFPSWRVLTTVPIMLVVLMALAFFLRSRPESTGPYASPVRFSLALPDETDLLGAQFAVSPDGTQLAVAARSADGRQGIWVRRLRSLEWRELPRTGHAASPFWSPDSRHIGFFDDRSLKRIDVSSELIQTICDASSARGASWSVQDVILFSDASGLSLVRASGGTPAPLTKVDSGRGEIAHLWPQFLPDGRHFIFAAQKLKPSFTTYIGDVNTSKTTAIADERGPAMLAGNVLLFLRGNTLAAQPFDASRRAPGGEAQSIAGTDDIATSMKSGPVFSASSTLLVYQRDEPRLRRLMWFDRTGRVIGTAGMAADDEGFALSPDGRRVAVARRDARNDTSSIWLMDVNPERTSRLTPGQGQDAFPIWSPDGSRVAFSSRRDDSDDVYTIVANGAKEQLLFRSPESKRLSDWSRDGRFVIYTARSPKTGTDLWALQSGEDHKPQPIDQSPANESQGVLSPDDRWIAYVSDESGSDEVYVRSFPASEGRWQISTGGGTQPRWRSDGRELYFISAESRLTAVEVASAPQLTYRAPQTLFVLRGAGDYAVAPDGRFLVLMPVGERGNRELQVVLNWASELRR
jgi:eukaryotic-like serine/threonine-protein kinase